MFGLSERAETIRQLNDEFRENLPPNINHMVLSRGIGEKFPNKAEMLEALCVGVKSVTKYFAQHSHSSGLIVCAGNEIHWFIHYLGHGHEMCGDPADSKNCRRVIEFKLWGAEIA